MCLFKIILRLFTRRKSICTMLKVNLFLQFLCVLCVLLALQALALIIALIFEKTVRSLERCESVCAVRFCVNFVFSVYRQSSCSRTVYGRESSITMMTWTLKTYWTMCRRRLFTYCTVNRIFFALSCSDNEYLNKSTKAMSADLINILSCRLLSFLVVAEMSTRTGK